MYEFDYNKLRGRIREKGFRSEAAFARHVDMSLSALSLRLNSKLEFSQSDVVVCAAALNIDKGDIGEYFFNCPVHKSEQTGASA